MEAAGGFESAVFDRDQASVVRQLLASLNEQQQIAVQTTEGPVLVLAGAGSGKTRVLTYRIAYLIAKGVIPTRILALTFTNKAAMEMRERVLRLLPQSVAVSASRLWIGTFHSLFARLLRREAEKLGYTAAFTIYDEHDSRQVIRMVLEQLRISPKEYSPESIARLISKAKNQMLSWQDFARQASSPILEIAAQVYPEYERRLAANNAMDFDDLLLKTLQLLQEFPAIRQQYQQQFQYILVDEYQDTNAVQFAVLQQLAQEHRNLCVVGDDAQSIYGWRGADLTNILEFQRHFPDAVVIRLEQNYRSTQTILEAANAVIRNNRQQLEKRLWTDRGKGEPITVIEARDERGEAEQVARYIAESVAQGYRYRDIAILYRINALSQPLEETFRHQGIPYHIVSGVSFYRRKEVKDTLAYLQLLLNDRDDTIVLRVINEPPRGIGQKTVQILQQIAASTHQSLFAVLERASEYEQLSVRSKAAIQNFVDLIQFYRKVLRSQPAAEVVQRYIEATGLLAYYQARQGEEAYEREQNIRRVLDHFAEYMERNSEADLQAYLQEMALIETLDETDLEEDKVHLLTLHAAKGLEFPVVFIVAMEKAIFPLPRAYHNMAEMEEERRLFYVGITRAKERLYLSCARYRYQRGQRLPATPSPFLEEIPQTLIRRTPGQLEPPSRRRLSASSHGSPYRSGMKVRHPVFGVGKILGKRYAGEREILVVHFARFGLKSLVPEYAKLDIVE